MSIVDFHQLIDVFRVSFKRREHNLRRVIVILIFLMLLNVTIFSKYFFVIQCIYFLAQVMVEYCTCMLGKSSSGMSNSLQSSKHV